MSHKTLPSHNTIINTNLATNITTINTARMATNMLATNRIRTTNSVGVALPWA